MYKQTIFEEEQALSLNQFMELVDDEEKEKVAELLGHTTMQELFHKQNTGYEWIQTHSVKY